MCSDRAGRQTLTSGKDIATGLATVYLRPAHTKAPVADRESRSSAQTSVTASEDAEESGASAQQAATGATGTAASAGQPEKTLRERA